MNLQSITLGGGSFWPLGAVYELVDGVQGVESGYATGPVRDPAHDDQRHFANHPGQGWCAFAVAPKVAKLRKTFRARVRSAA